MMNKLQQMRQQQQKWLQEREASIKDETPYTTLMEVVPSAPPPSATDKMACIPPPPPPNPDVDIGSDMTCPICFEVMIPPERSPQILFPCGHTFCIMCIKESRMKLDAKSCPYCRGVIVSQGPNIALQQLILSYVGQKNGTHKPNHQPAIAAADLPLADTLSRYTTPDMLPTAVNYLKDYRTCAMRLRMLNTELEEAEMTLSSISGDTDMLASDVHFHAIQETQIEENIQQLQAQLAESRRERKEKEIRLAQLRKNQEGHEAKLKLVSSTIIPLTQQMKKAKLLLENFAPGMPIEDEYF